MASRFKFWMKQLFRTLRLDAELEDYSLIQESIEKGIVFKGTNLWILIFAIVVASVGLNMNSTAVIIGAMLISPLMGPINGIGYSIATYNLDLFKRSLKNFAFAVIASIAASFIYFLLSPVSNAQSELLARTSPTIFDVLIALFGGFAGIVAMCSKQKGNVIPGVAIATALMPPICTVGYGLAVGNSSYFFGALYLFTINTVFIALSSMVVSQILKFPKHSFISEKYKKITKYALYFVIALTIVPSLYLGYTLVKKEKFVNSANLYVENLSKYRNYFLLKSDIDPATNTIKLVYGGNSMTSEERQDIKDLASSYGIEHATIIIEQGLQMDDFADEFNEVDQLKQEFSRVLTIIDFKDQQLDSIQNIPQLGEQLYKEALVFYPELISITYSNTKQFSDGKSKPITLITIESDKAVKTKNEEKIIEWLNQRITTKDSLVVVFED